MGFAFLGAAVAVGVAAIAYTLTRTNITDEREAAALQRLYSDGRLVRAALDAGEDDVVELLSAVSTSSGAELHLRWEGAWFASSVSSSPDSIPASLRSVIDSGGGGQQRFRDGDGNLLLAQGIALPAVDAALFEIVPFDEVEETLGALERSLGVGVVGTALAAAAVGRQLATRLARPLGSFGAAARRLADGDLSTRMGVEVDPDLRSLAQAFDEMAARLDERIKRDIRYAADVSHELRSPLAAITAAAEVLSRRRHEFSDASVTALDVLVDRVDSFRRAVDDLLEMARIDGGQVELLPEVLDLERFARELVRVTGDDGVVLDVPTSASVVADRRRLARAVGNLLDNARNYGGGATALRVEQFDGIVRIAVEDNGPGVPAEEREAVFTRFARGQAGTDAGTPSGSGLGLSLVAEHVALHGGRSWVEDAPGGGARFVIELPQRPGDDCR